MSSQVRPAASSVQFPQLTFGAATDTGRQREHNEDAYLVKQPIFAVADGMGGHHAGEVASKIVVDRFAELADRDDIGQAAMIECLARCRDDIARIPKPPGAFAAPGTTVVALAQVVEADSPYWLVAYLGDSRCYQWTMREFELISQDHSLVQELIDAGQITEEQARVHRLRHVITRSIDAVEETPADYALVPVVGESRMLLCSDGINNELTDLQIEAILARADDAQTTAENLVAEAVEAGGRDNATAVVIDVGGTTQEYTTLRRRAISEWPPLPDQHDPKRSTP